MANTEELEWSPARNPYAIAVSQSWLALQAATLFAADAKERHGSAQQIYARQLFGQLRVLRCCAEMMATELKHEGVAEAARDRLQGELEAFDVAAPDVKDARDILEHFDAYARGQGNLARRAMQDRSRSLSRTRSGQRSACSARSTPLDEPSIAQEQRAPEAVSASRGGWQERALRAGELCRGPESRSLRGRAWTAKSTAGSIS
jgi:hypothetical protein